MVKQVTGYKYQATAANQPQIVSQVLDIKIKRKQLRGDDDR